MTVQAPTTGPTAADVAGRLFESTLAMMDILSVALGQQLGLYQALVDGGPATPAALASRTNLHERYVREWLEQQAVTGLLEYDAATGAFAISDGVREVVLEEESLNYLGAFAPMSVALAHRLPDVAEAFRTGGGVAWSDYGPLMVMGQGAINRPLFLKKLSQEYFPRVPGLVETLSRPGARVADVGCGVGWSAIGIAESFPAATVDGFDPDGPSITQGQEYAAARGVADRVNLQPTVASAGTPGSYDLVAAFECIHDMSDPVGVLSSMRELAKPGGTVLVMDERVGDEFAGPADDVERIMYGWSLFCCLPAGMAESPSAGTGTVMRQPTLERYAANAGFSAVEVLPIEDDFFRFYRLVA